MANTIRHKRGTTAPGAASLVTGELAINTNTGEVYTKKNDGTVQIIGTGTFLPLSGGTVNGSVSISSGTGLYVQDSNWTAHLTPYGIDLISCSFTTSGLTLPAGGVTFSDSTVQTTAGIGEAPNDGNEYVRKNLGWTVATGGGSGGLTISYLSNGTTSTLDTTAPTTGQALTFDGTNLKWATVGGGGGGSGTLTMSSGQLYDGSTANYVPDLTLSGTLSAASVTGTTVTGGSHVLNSTGLSLASGSGAVITFADGTTQSSAGITSGSLSATLANYALLSGATFTGKVKTVASTSGSAGLNVAPGAIPTAPADGDIWTNSVNLFWRVGGVTMTPVTTAGATLTGTLVTVAPTSTVAGLRLPHGAAPTSPVNGDLWTTTGGAYVRINSSTQQIAVAGISTTFSAKQFFSQSSSTTAPLNVGGGFTTNPSSPSNGDISTNSTTGAGQIVGRSNSMFGAMTACRAFATLTISAGTPTVATGAWNVSSVTDNGVGDFTLNFTAAITDANYVYTLEAQEASGGTSYYGYETWASNIAAGTLRIRYTANSNSGITTIDPAAYRVAIFR